MDLDVCFVMKGFNSDFWAVSKMVLRFVWYFRGDCSDLEEYITPLLSLRSNPPLICVLPALPLSSCYFARLSTFNTHNRSDTDAQLATTARLPTLYFSPDWSVPETAGRHIESTVSGSVPVCSNPVLLSRTGGRGAGGSAVLSLSRFAKDREVFQHKFHWYHLHQRAIKLIYYKYSSHVFTAHILGPATSFKVSTCRCSGSVSVGQTGGNQEKRKKQVGDRRREGREAEEKLMK